MGGIFDGNINARATAVMMVAMLFFACAWESFTAWLEKQCADNKAHKEMLSKAFKELIILGFIAFSVILGKEVGLVQWNPDLLLCFEFCDLVVSITVFVYVANTALSSFTMHIARREWDRISMTPTSVTISEVKFYLEGLETSRWKRFKHAMPFIATSWRYDADFKILALLFKNKFHLDVHFDYVMYVKQVLGDIVVSTANLSTWHWVIIMAINALWYVAMVYVMPIFGYVAMDEPVTCPFCMGDSEEAAAASNRRQLGAAAGPKVCRAELAGDTCEMDANQLEAAALRLADVNGTENYWAQCSACANEKDADISSADTLVYTLMFIAIGWFVALMQAFIVLDLMRRTKLVLTFSGARDDDQAVPDLLEELQKQLLPRNRAAALAKAIQDRTRSMLPTDAELDDDDDDDDRVDFNSVSDSHHSHLVRLDMDDDEIVADHLMVFHDTDQEGKPPKTSNDILSLKHFDALMFTSMTWQLITDFYVSFYWVHMAQRVPIAVGQESTWSGGYVQQLMLHTAIITPVCLTLYLLMLTTRQLSLLRGVLHMDEDAVGDVLTQMDRVRDIRSRIRTTLKNAGGKKRKKDVHHARQLLEKAEAGELAILRMLAKRKTRARIERQEMRAIIKANQSLLVSQKNLKRYLDRGSAKAFELLSRADQATAMTAKTLKEGDTEEQDSVEIWDFSTLLVRKLAEQLLFARESGAPPEELKAIQTKITALDSVDDYMIEYGERLSHAKTLFNATDKDGSGGVSRNELYGALKRHRVAITKSEFQAIFRVIDPDQSNTMSMEEWVDFMMASDADFETQALEAAELQRQLNAAKGTSLGTLAGESAGFLLGGKVGGLVGGVVGQLEQVVDGTLDVVGNGLDKAGLGVIADEIRENPEEEAELARRRDDALRQSQREPDGLPVVAGLDAPRLSVDDPELFETEPPPQPPNAS